MIPQLPVELGGLCSNCAPCISCPVPNQQNKIDGQKMISRPNPIATASNRSLQNPAVQSNTKGIGPSIQPFPPRLGVHPERAAERHGQSTRTLLQRHTLKCRVAAGKLEAPALCASQMSSRQLKNHVSIERPAKGSARRATVTMLGMTAQMAMCILALSGVSHSRQRLRNTQRTQPKGPKALQPASPLARKG